MREDVCVKAYQDDEVVVNRDFFSLLKTLTLCHSKSLPVILYYRHKSLQIIVFTFLG